MGNKIVNQVTFDFQLDIEFCREATKGQFNTIADYCVKALLGDLGQLKITKRHDSLNIYNFNQLP